MLEVSRRAMLVAGGLGLAASMSRPAMAATTKGATGATLRLAPGVQLYTVKEDLAHDFDGTLRALKRIGYQRVEAAGWVGRTPAAFRQGVEAAGLECVSCHFSMRDLIDEHDSKLAQARDVGVRYFVASSPAATKPQDMTKSWNIGLAESMTLADWHRNAEAMNRIGRSAKAMGMRFGYHNHAAEMLDYEGKNAFHELVRLTDPALVTFELDLGWVAAAGHDPATTIDHHRDRIELLHVKDIAAKAPGVNRIAPDVASTPVGAGVIHWKPVFAAADRARIGAWFVEQEPPYVQPALNGVAKSLAYLRTLRG